jgi:hypothetical protein
VRKCLALWRMIIQRGRAVLVEGSKVGKNGRVLPISLLVLLEADSQQQSAVVMTTD